MSVSEARHSALVPAAVGNHLLAALPADDLRRLTASLELVHCPSGMLLLDEGQRVDRVYFPATCIAARFCTLDDGVTAEQGIAGCDSVVGVAAFLGGGTMPWRVETVIGGDAFRMPAAALLAEFRLGGALQRVLLQYTRELIVRVSAEAVCRAHHTVERRLARLLLEVADLGSGADLPLSQQSLGMLLGARRETVCHATARLQDEGCIHHERARVSIRDTARLRKASCTCYRPAATPKTHEP
jgi:CRP-like cAMP-binding protein